MTEQEAQQAQTIEDHAEFVAKFKEFASEPQNELSKQSEEVLQSKLNQAEKSLIDLQAQEIARLESKKTQVFQVCRANIKWQREQRKLQAQKIAEQAKEIERLQEYSNIAWNELTQLVRERDKRLQLKKINSCKDCHGTGIIEWYEDEHNGWNTMDCTSCYGQTTDSEEVAR